MAHYYTSSRTRWDDQLITLTFTANQIEKGMQSCIILTRIKTNWIKSGYRWYRCIVKDKVFITKRLAICGIGERKRCCTVHCFNTVTH